MKIISRVQYISLFTMVCLNNLFSQPLPSEDESIPFVVTFSKGASLKYGDDDFTQTFFFVIPENTAKPFFIRIFDPETSGKHDEIYGPTNSKTRFSVYGGTITINGSQEKQKLFFSKLFDKAQKYNCRFIINFVIRDYDQLWQEIGSPDDVYKLWKDTGIYDGDGNARIIKNLWLEKLKLTLKSD